MLHETTPTYELAVNDFVERYVDLISTTRAELGPFEAGLLSAKDETLWLAVTKNRDRILEQRAVRATLSSLDRAASKGNTRRLVIVIYNMLDAFREAFHQSMADYRAARFGDDSRDYRQRVKDWLEAYQTIYERLLRTVYGPVVSAHRMAYPSAKLDEFKLDSDGRARLSSIAEIERSSAFPMDLYGLGLNATLRNAIAHRSFQIFEHEEYVEYWDGKSPRTPISEDVLRNTCEDALINASHIVDAVLVWFANHSTVARSRGWLKDPRPRQCGWTEYEAAIRQYFKGFGFKVVEVTRIDGVDNFSLRTGSRGIDQTSTIYRSGEGWTESFDVKITYVETPIVPQVLGAIQQLTAAYETAESFCVSVVDSEDPIVGVLRAKYAVIRSLKGPGKDDHAKIRCAFDEDTIGDKTMWREERDTPVRATPRLRTDE